MNYLAIFIGGGIGSLLRYFTTTTFKKTILFNVPSGTFLSNILASLILGLVVGFLLTKNINNQILKNFLLIGICGGFSTFSTFGYENFTLISQNQISSSFLYIAISILTSILLIFIGIQISTYLLSNFSS